MTIKGKSSKALFDTIVPSSLCFPAEPVTQTHTQAQTEFVIQPNAVYHGHGWLWPFALLTVICIGIGLRFAWLGYWMILPFAILDILAVGLIIRFVLRKSHYIEKISIDPQQLRIEHIQPNRNRSWKFPLYWTRVQLKSPNHRWYPHRLQFGYKGEWVEIGQCLTDSERKSLARAIREEVDRIKNPQPGDYA